MAVTQQARDGLRRERQVATQTVELPPAQESDFQKAAEAAGCPIGLSFIGWEGGEQGSTLKPPEYMNLAGPWVDGKDPATVLLV